MTDWTAHPEGKEERQKRGVKILSVILPKRVLAKKFSPYKDKVNLEKSL